MTTLGIGTAATQVAAGAGMGAGAPSSGTSKATQEANQAVSFFMQYMKETPAQRFEDSWLAAHGLTEKDLQNMSPEKREAILKQMAEDMKRQMQQQVQQAQKKAGAGLTGSTVSTS